MVVKDCTCTVLLRLKIMFDEIFPWEKKSISIFVSLPGKQMCYYAKYDTQCYGSPNINCVLYHNSVHGVQEGFLHYVLYEIHHTVVPVLQYCCLQHVLYQIQYWTILDLQYCCLQHVLYHIQHWTVLVLQYSCLQHVLYHIQHWTVPVLQYCCLHYVLYQIDHKVVPGLQEWLLHNVSLFRTTITINVLDIIIYCGNNLCKNNSKR